MITFNSRGHFENCGFVKTTSAPKARENGIRPLFFTF